MDATQCLQAKRQALKGSVTKLFTKVEDMIYADLEGVTSESITEARKLMAVTTLGQLQTKRDQIVELDTAIVDKIEAATEFEEETINAQLTLEERIAFLAEFVRKAGLSPPTVPSPLVLPPTSAVDTLSDTPSHTTTPVSVADMHTDDIHAHADDTPRTFQNVSRLRYLCLHLVETPYYGKRFGIPLMQLFI